MAVGGNFRRANCIQCTPVCPRCRVYLFGNIGNCDVTPPIGGAFSAAVFLRPTLEIPAMGLWSTKSITLLQSEAAAEGEAVTLKRALGALNLTMLGIGAIIG